MHTRSSILFFKLIYKILDNQTVIVFFKFSSYGLYKLSSRMIVNKHLIAMKKEYIVKYRGRQILLRKFNPSS